MVDPYAFITPHCKYTSSQKDIFNQTLSVREDISPGSYPAPPSTAAASALDANISCSDPVSDDINAIIICSAPESQVSDSGDEFKTPPEESRPSSSEEAPPLKLSYLHDTGGNGTATAKADSGVLEGDTPDLGFSQGSKMVQVLPDGDNQVKEVSVVDHESFRAGEKQSVVEDPPPSEIVRVSVDSLVLVKTALNLATGDKGRCLRKWKPNSLVEIDVDMNGETQVKEVSDFAGDSTVIVKTTPNPETDSLVEIEVEVGMNGENQVKEVSDADHESFRVGQKRSAVEEAWPSKRVRASVDSTVVAAGKCLEQRQTDSPFEIEGNVETEAYFVDSGDTVVLDEDYNCGEEYCGNNVGFSNVEQVQEENKEAGVDNAENHSRQERRELPSWARQNGDNRKKSEEENHLNTQEAVDGSIGLLLEILALLAEEEGQNGGDNDHGNVDILETAKRKGMKFPEPKWWRDDGDDST